MKIQKRKIRLGLKKKKEVKDALNKNVSLGISFW